MPSSSSDSQDSIRLVWIALALATVGAAAMLYYHQRLFLPRARAVSVERGLGGGYTLGNDFYPVWVTAREALGGRDPYSAGMTREIQIGLFGRPLDRPGDPKDLRTFAHPAYTLLLMWPAAAMRFEAARVAIGILLLAFMPASVWLWLKALGWHVCWPWMLVIVVLSVCSYPGAGRLVCGAIGPGGRISAGGGDRGCEAWTVAAGRSSHRADDDQAADDSAGDGLRSALDFF